MERYIESQGDGYDEVKPRKLQLLPSVILFLLLGADGGALALSIYHFVLNAYVTDAKLEDVAFGLLFLSV